MSDELTVTGKQLAEHQKRSVLFDRLEQAIADMLPPVDLPLHHEFCRNEQGEVKQYVRSCVLLAGSLWTTKIHKTEHPFFILKGHAVVRDVNGRDLELFGGCWGKTTPGTRRAIVALEDTVWVTVHAVGTDDMDLIEQELIEPHFIPQRKEIAA